MRGRTIAKIVVGVLVVGAGLGYVAFKDDITAFWDNLHAKDRGVSATEENRLARPGHS